jgi:uncharacterized protein YndB with AHSA1/START domain
MTSVSIVRRIAARPSIVFAALASADGMYHWIGPDAGPVLSAEADPQVGGRYRARFRKLDGSEHEAFGEYIEVAPPERLAMSWRWLGGQEDPGESRLEFVLRPIPQGTELTLTHSLLQETSAESHREGWLGAIDKLEQYFLAQTTS